MRNSDYWFILKFLKIGSKSEDVISTFEVSKFQIQDFIASKSPCDFTPEVDDELERNYITNIRKSFNGSMALMKSLIEDENGCQLELASQLVTFLQDLLETLQIVLDECYSGPMHRILTSPMVTNNKSAVKKRLYCLETTFLEYEANLKAYFYYRTKIPSYSFFPLFGGLSIQEYLQYVADNTDMYYDDDDDGSFIDTDDDFENVLFQNDYSSYADTDDDLENVLFKENFNTDFDEINSNAADNTDMDYTGSSEFTDYNWDDDGDSSINWSTYKGHIKNIHYRLDTDEVLLNEDTATSDILHKEDVRNNYELHWLDAPVFIPKEYHIELPIEIHYNLISSDAPLQVNLTQSNTKVTLREIQPLKFANANSKLLSASQGISLHINDYLHKNATEINSSKTEDVSH